MSQLVSVTVLRRRCIQQSDAALDDGRTRVWIESTLPFIAFR
jgi:hypothetical protein